MNKRVEIIVPFFVPPYIGGTEAVLKKWYMYFLKKNSQSAEEVDFILPFSNRRGNLFGDNKKYLRCAPKIFSGSFLMKLAGVIFLCIHLIFTKADSVIVLSPKYIKLSFYMRKLFRKKYKVISWIHFSLSNMFTENSSDLKKADYHFAISTGIAKQLVEMGIDEKKVYVIYNPIEENTRTVEKSDSPKYIYIGRVERYKQKNLQELLNGFSLVLKSLPKATLEIWGDGEDLDSLKKVSYDLNIKNHVSFMGWSLDPWSHIDYATALIMTSTFEGLPMTILESLSQGLPVISSDIQTGPSDEISKKNGLLYQLNNVSELSSGMEKMYTDRDVYKATEIKESISTFYSDRYFKRIVQIIKNMK